ncbi:MAG TPA: glycosyltransferase family 4 protein [Chloroflexota bacterium]|jgi:glycosyltransferase involved in cell wall biosynthesis|nr:glycosyltransferase family 4 protein [Chloroflexota bacterium]
MNRPTIVLLSDYPSDHATFSGGIQTATAGLLEALRPYRHAFDFHLVSFSRAIANDVYESRDGFCFHFLGLAAWDWLPTRAPVRLLKVHRELRRIRPSLVHCHANTIGCLAVIAGGYRRVLTVHGVGQDEARLRTGRPVGSAAAIARLERMVHARFPAFICISAYAAGVVSGRGAATFTIPNAVESRFFEHQADMTAAQRVLYLGVLAPLKRPLDLLLAHAEVRQSLATVQTAFCGQVEDAEYARSLRRLVVEQRIGGVQFLEVASRARVLELLAQAAVLVLPSAQENAPMVVAEAMALGVPVVATAVGGIPGMITHGQTGFLFTPGDVGALASHLRRLLTDSALRRRMGQGARQRAQRTFAPSVVGEATVAAYQELLGAPVSVHSRAPTAVHA